MKPRFVALLALLATLSLSSSSQLASAQCADWRGGPLGNGVANGADGAITASTLWDPDGAGPLPLMLVVGGTFNNIEGVAAHHIAMRNPNTGVWSAIGNGFGTTPNSIIVHNGQLVVGGGGDSDPGTFDNNLLYFDGSAWQTFNGGTNTGSVYALASYNGELYAGGNFVIYPTPLNPAVDFAHWNTSAHLWEPVNTTFGQTDGAVRAFMPWNGELLVVGDFVSIGSTTANHIARFTGSSFLAWGSGHSQAILSIGIYNGNIAIGSSFSTPTGFSPTVGVWNGSGWTPLGGNYPNGVDNLISQIVNFNGSLYIGGYFTKANNSTTGAHVAVYNGSSWQPLTTGTDGPVYTMMPFNGELIVGGNFLNAGGQPANHIARWTGSAWSSYGGGVANSVLAMTQFGSWIVGGGDFTQSLDVGNSAHFIGGFDGASLHAFGTGMDNPVFALKSFTYPGVFGNNELIAGGSFTHAGGISANFIARWDQNPISVFPTPAWTAMGPGFSGPVNAIERFNSVTYAGGSFVSSGVTSVNRIARWNETSKLWEALGTGMNNAVFALCSYGGYLYAGGQFTTANGVSTGGLARWDGSTWSQVGGFFNGTVYALTVHNGVLVIGGLYPGINSSPNIAYYNGTSYGTFGSNQGTNGAVRSLHSTGGRLYMGGDFTTIGGATVGHCAYNFFGLWFAMNGGTDNNVYALAHYHNIIDVGGTFNHVRGTALLSDSWALFDETGGPQIRSNPASQVATYGDNVAFTCLPDTGYTGLTLQWYFNGVPLADGPTGHGSTILGSHSEVLNVLNFGAGDIGNYSMTVSNACTSTSSNVATLNGNVDVDGAGLPHATTFDAIAPNPARQATRLAFSLARDARVRVRIQDVAGRTIRGIDVGALAAGQHSLAWDMRGDDGAISRPGMYFVALEVDGRRLGMKTLAIVR